MAFAGGESAPRLDARVSPVNPGKALFGHQTGRGIGAGSAIGHRTFAPS
jgi:hypothetical protein